MAGLRARPAPGLALGAPRRRDGAGGRLEVRPAARLPGLHELALDNDCILWSRPASVDELLARDDALLLAADVRRMLGAFADRCDARATNTGIRGLPPGFDLAAALRAALREDDLLRTELDEQGLQTAALQRAGELLLVPVDDVAVCSPFPPHAQSPGRCGVHFVGLNARDLGWELGGRRASDLTAEAFDRMVPEIRARVAGTA